MANTPQYSESPANKALQHYFDDLILPQNDQTQEKLSQAALLLAKANSVDNLLSVGAEKSSEKTSQVLAEDSVKTTLSSSFSNVYPVDEVDIALNDKQTLNQDEDNSEKSTRAYKENGLHADITKTRHNNSGQTRNIAISLKDSLPNRFQVLLCDIANVTIAIPLLELGGIHKLTKISAMAKQPSWCKGIFMKGSEKFTCVDVAEWLLPKKCSELKQDNEYKFAVQLGKTPYVLCCNSIVCTLDVSKEDIKWRDNIATRPWLSGLLKERMCGLIDGARIVQDVLN
jgi:purine-binding chemotaxis protein CheW